MTGLWKFGKRVGIAVCVVVAAVLVWYLISRILSPYNTVKRYALQIAAPSGHASDKTAFKVGSYNIAHARGGTLGATNWQDRTEEEVLRHLDKIAAQIKQAQLDVVVLNEVDFSAAWSRSVNHARHIARKAGYPFVVEQRNMDIAFPFFSFKFGNAILSRYPLKDSVFIDFPPLSKWEDMFAGNHDGVLAIVETPLGQIGMIAVHLDYRSEWCRIRCAEHMKKLADQYAFPIIAAGDFNSAPLTFSNAQRGPTGKNALTYLLSQGGFDSHPGIIDKRPHHTFPSGRPASSIDWILERGDLEIKSARVIASQLSDHLMITATLGLKMGRPPISSSSE